MNTSRFLIGVVALATLTSCGGGGDPPTAAGPITVLVMPPNPQVQVGFTVQLTATVAGPPGIPQRVLWRSLDTLIATVNSSGLVTGIAEGSGIIRVSWAEDTLEFTDAAVTVTTTPVEGVRRAGQRAKGSAQR